MNRMKLLMCSLAVLCALAVSANAATHRAAGASKTLTGCLQKGTDPGTYMLTNVTGGPEATNKDWELIGAPASLKMDDHVGHKISVTGSVVGAGAAAKIEEKSAGKTETTKTAMPEEKTERHLKVRSMKHIAGTCP
jgi:hypothetical protein